MRHLLSLLLAALTAALLWLSFSHGSPETPIAEGGDVVPSIDVPAPTVEPETPVVQSVCRCGPVCRCAEGVPCDDETCPNANDEERFAVAYHAALAQKKTLLIWVRQHCQCQQEMPEYLHCHLLRYNGANGPEESCEVVVGRPSPTGGLEVVGRIAGCPEDLPARVRAMLNPPMEQQASATVQYAGFSGGFCAGGS